MIALTKTFTRCGHCGHNAAQPVYTCPMCDWPRAHGDETPPPAVGLPDNSFRPGEIPKPAAAPQLATVMPSPVQYDDVPSMVPPVPQAPAMVLEALPDLGAVPEEFGIKAVPIEPVPVSYEPMPDADAATLAAQTAERRAALQAQLDAAAAAEPDSPDTILANLNYTPKPLSRKKK